MGMALIPVSCTMSRASFRSSYGHREFDLDDKTAGWFSCCFKALAASAVGRQSIGAPEEIRGMLSQLNGDGMFTAMEVGVSMSLLENVCFAAETFAGSGNDLYKTDAIKRWASALIELKDSADVLPGRGWEGDAAFSPAVSFIVALRYVKTWTTLLPTCACNGQVNRDKTPLWLK